MVNAGSAIKLTFSDLEMEEHDDCSFDYIQVIDKIKHFNSKLIFNIFRSSLMDQTHHQKAWANIVEAKEFLNPFSPHQIFSLCI